MGPKKPSLKIGYVQISPNGPYLGPYFGHYYPDYTYNYSVFATYGWVKKAKTENLVQIGSDGPESVKFFF